MRKTFQNWRLWMGLSLKRWLPLIATLCLILFLSTPATEVVGAPSAIAQISDEVEQMVVAAGLARVLILLDDSGLTDTVMAAAQQPVVVAQRQRSVLSTLAPDEFQVYRQYQYVPGLAGNITAAGLQKLRTNPLVRAIQLDHPGGAHLEQSLPALGGEIVHNTYGITGRGVTVAVLDSGIDTDHPDLADDLIAQHCFTNGDCPPTNLREGTNAEDENGHGTHVAGIITANGTVSGAGFAPDANVIAVRVLDTNGSGFVSDWVAGLDWVRAQMATTPLQIVNMSLGTFSLYSGNCDAQEALMANAIGQLRAQGVTIFASSGNQGSSTRIASPACNSGVIAVGATYDGNVGRQPVAGTYQSSFGSGWPACVDNATTLQTITCFTNSNGQLDLVAPGAPIRSTYKDGGVAAYWGTSQASPTAAGIAALLLEKRPDLTPAQIEALLKTSGPQVVDVKNGRQFPMINALNALDAITPVAPAALAIQGPTTGYAGVTHLFVAQLAPVTATVPLTYHWQVAGQSPMTKTGGLTSTLALTWSQSGVYALAVQAVNAGGMVSATHQITIEAIAPDAIVLTGPPVVSAGVPETFFATVQPLSATTPITYVWQMPDRPPIIHTNGITDSHTLVWDELGVQPITVTVFNEAGMISATPLVTVQLVAPLAVTVQGELTTTVGVSTTLTAQVSPIMTSLPITYSWTATDQTPVTRIAGLSDTMTYHWNTSGPVTVTVQAQNPAGGVVNQHVIWIAEERRSYLPIVHGQ